VHVDINRPLMLGARSYMCDTAYNNAVGLGYRPKYWQLKFGIKQVARRQ